MLESQSRIQKTRILA